MREKISFVLVGSLLIIAIALTFWIHAALGLVVLLFCLAVFGYIYGVYKKRIDQVLAEVAKRTGLRYQKGTLTHGVLKGKYRGYDTEVGVYSSFDGMGGLGTLLTATTGMAGLSTLDIQNVTTIRMTHDLPVSEEKIISRDWPTVLVQRGRIVLSLPYVSRSADEIVRCLERLAEEVELLSRQSGSKP